MTIKQLPCCLCTADSNSTQQLVELLVPSQPLLCAYVGGIMWELTADPDTAQLLLEAGIVPVLLAVVRAVSSAGLSKRKWKSRVFGSSSHCSGGGMCVCERIMQCLSICGWQSCGVDG